MRVVNVKGGRGGEGMPELLFADRGGGIRVIRVLLRPRTGGRHTTAFSIRRLQSNISVFVNATPLTFPKTTNVLILPFWPFCVAKVDDVLYKKGDACDSYYSPYCMKD